jgi:tetratricopeptide (TPR) repeat protein
MTVSLKDQVLYILERSQEAKEAFVANLSDRQRSDVGTYERWCVKDNVAHIAYWQENRAKRLAALARGEEPPPSPSHYEQANAECFERYCNCSWDEVQAYADSAHAELVDAVRALEEDVLAKPASPSEERALWQDIVGTGYTHPLMHTAGYYTEHGQQHKASQLWQQWGQLVSPLDDSPEWQGTVHYNTACSLALSGSSDQAIAELRQALELRPSVTAWSRQDPDLQSLHKMPEYRELYAPEHWWKAIDANPQAEALADQFMRALAMFREVLKACPTEEWRKGDTPCQRPAGLALHLVEGIEFYSALKAGEGESGGFDVDWETEDASKLPSQDELLSYLNQVEEKLAGFLVEADLTGAEELFRWTGSTLLSRAAYSLRHTQHHLAEMCLELHRRGHPTPQWQ